MAALERFISLKEIEHLVVTHLTPKHVPSLKAFLKKRDASGSASKLQITLSNPAKQVLKTTMGMLIAQLQLCTLFAATSQSYEVSFKLLQSDSV